MESYMRLFAVVLAALAVACGPGEAGPPGPKGDPGVTLTKSHYCSGQIDIDGGGADMLASLNVYEFGDGSVMTSCEINSGGWSITGFEMYRKDQAGAKVASCFLVADWNDGSGGWWEFSADSARNTATTKYSDSTSVANGRSWKLTCEHF